MRLGSVEHLFQTALHMLIDGSSVGDIEPRRSDANSVVVERRAITLRRWLLRLYERSTSRNFVYLQRQCEFGMWNSQCDVEAFATWAKC